MKYPIMPVWYYWICQLHLDFYYSNFFHQNAVVFLCVNVYEFVVKCYNISQDMQMKIHSIKKITSKQQSAFIYFMYFSYHNLYIYLLKLRNISKKFQPKSKNKEFAKIIYTGTVFYICIDRSTFLLWTNTIIISQYTHLTDCKTQNKIPMLSNCWWHGWFLCKSFLCDWRTFHGIFRKYFSTKLWESTSKSSL